MTAKLERYLAIIQIPESETEAYGVIVPDIPGCFSAGDTLDEALENVKEAIAMQVEDILERGGQVPESTDLSSILSREWKHNEVSYLIDLDPREASRAKAAHASSKGARMR